MNFLANHWTEILLTLITTGLLAVCRAAYKRLSEYKTLLEDKEQEQIEELIEHKLEPLYAELEELRVHLKDSEDKEQSYFNLIISSYRYRLVQLCKTFLKQGYITSEQYDQLTEFYKVYSGLGGNGQAKEFYEKACKLPIRE